MVEMEMVALALSVFVCDESVVCVYAYFKKKVPKIWTLLLWRNSAKIWVNLSHVDLILKLK